MKTSQTPDTPADTGSPSVGESPESVLPSDQVDDQAAGTQTALPEVDPPSETDQERELREAPYGRKADGSPRAKPGRKGTANPEEQRERLQSVSRPPPRAPAQAAIVVAAPVKRDYDGVAKVATNMWFNIPTMFFGDEWGPDPKQGVVREGDREIPVEVQTVRLAFRDYFAAKDIGSIDPSVQLCVVLGGYTISRLTKPTLKSRVAAAWTWTKSKIVR